MEVLPNNSAISTEDLKKYGLTKTTNETYGQFYHFRRLLEAQKNKQKEEVSYYTHNSEYGKHDNVPRAGFKPVGLKSPGVRYGLGVTEGGATPVEAVEAANTPQPVEDNDNLDDIGKEEDDKVLKLPPIDQRYIAKAASTGRAIPKKTPLPTPNTWWMRKRPQVERPLPPTTGYAKRYMQQACPRLWDNMEVLAGRGVEARLAHHSPNILKVDNDNDAPCGDTENFMEYLNQRYGNLDADVSNSEQ